MELMHRSIYILRDAICENQSGGEAVPVGQAPVPDIATDINYTAFKAGMRGR